VVASKRKLAVSVNCASESVRVEFRNGLIGIELKISVPDRPGVLSEITLAISSAGINIEDISIFHSTEFSGGGILKVLVQGENAGEIAQRAVGKIGYESIVKKVLSE